MNLDTDKRTEDFSLRIPSITKTLLDGLTKHQKSRLNDEILVTIAKALHASRFDAERYLKGDLT